MVVHVTTVAFALFIIYKAWPGSSLFSFHPSLMAVGFTLLLTEAVMVFSPSSSLLLSSRWKTKATAHWLLQLSALLCVTGGLGAIYYNKELHEKPHFTTWHGTFGLVTVGGMAVGMFGGMAALYPTKLVPWWSPRYVRMMHATGGLFLFILVTVTFHLAFFSTWFEKNCNTFEWMACVTCISTAALSVMVQVTQKYVPTVKKLQSSKAPGKAKAN